MIRRRAVLGASGLAVASGLAGCSVLGSDESDVGQPARFGRGATAPANPEVVALSDTAAGGRPKGRLESSTAAFEKEGGEIVVVSYHRVAAGAAAFSSEWRYADVGATHDWTAADGELTATETNMTTVDADSPDVAFRLAAEASEGSRSWRVVLPEPSTQSVAYRFRSEFEPATSVTDGDELATVTGSTELTDGSLIGGTTTVETEHALVYGDMATDENE